MRTSRISLIFAFALIVLLPMSAQAEPMGTAFTYQGRLIDANEAADGLYDFQFKLFDANTGANKLGPDVNKPEVDVIDGYFTVELDFGNVFDGNERWLEIGVRPGEQNDPNAYTLLSPRQKVTPTPYAIYAETVGSVGWGKVTDHPAGLDDGDDVGITNETDPTVLASVKDGVSWSEVSDRPVGLDDGDDVGITSETDPTVLASVKDGVSWGEVSDRPAGLDDGDDVGITSETDPQVGSNTTNYIPKWDGSALVSGTIYDNGNVGIGTTDPGSYKLNVNGNMYATAYYGSGANLTGITVGDGTISQAKLKTAMGGVSHGGVGGYGNYILPGGEYGFYPQLRVTYGRAQAVLSDIADIGSSYATRISISAEFGFGGAIVYAQQRYVTASGQDHWLFLLVDKVTKDVISAYSAPDHPSYGNGGDFDKVPHPFPDYDETKHEIVLLDKTTCQKLKQESEQTGESILTLVNEDYKPKMDEEEIYQPLHSGKFLTENGEQVKQMVQSIPSYIKVRKLEKLTEQDKQDREIIRQQKIQQAEQEKQKKEQNRQKAINKLKVLGLDEAELFALIEK